MQAYQRVLSVSVVIELVRPPTSWRMAFRARFSQTSLVEVFMTLRPALCRRVFVSRFSSLWVLVAFSTSHPRMFFYKFEASIFTVRFLEGRKFVRTLEIRIPWCFVTLGALRVFVLSIMDIFVRMAIHALDATRKLLKLIWRLPSMTILTLCHRMLGHQLKLGAPVVIEYGLGLPTRRFVAYFARGWIAELLETVAVRAV